jgi:hypothetical protein
VCISSRSFPWLIDPPPPISTQTSGSSSQKPKVTRLGSLKSFTSNSSIGSQMSTLGPLLGSPPVLINEPNTCRNAPSVPQSLLPHNLFVASLLHRMFRPTRHNSMRSTHSLREGRFSSSEACLPRPLSSPQGLSAEEALH